MTSGFSRRIAPRTSSSGDTTAVSTPDALELRVEPNGRLDVGERDQDFHDGSWSVLVLGVAARLRDDYDASVIGRRPGRSRPRDPRSARGRAARRARRRASPGRFTISVRSRDPATPRDSAARGNASMHVTRSRSAIPSASRSSTARVASGVLSRGERPVPPVVSTRSARVAVAPGERAA